MKEMIWLTLVQALYITNKGIYKPKEEKTYLWTCGASDNSDQPVHLRSLIRWDAQANQNLRWPPEEI